MCLLPLAFVTFESRYSKRLVIAAEIGVFALLWFAHFTPLPVNIALTALGIFYFWIQVKFQKKTKVVWIGVFGVLLIFWTGSFFAEEKIKHWIKLQPGRIEVAQIARSPAPGNPFCWVFTTLAVQDGSQYVAQRGVLSLLPSLFSAKCCYPLEDFEVGALFIPVQQVVSGTSVWMLAEFRRPLKEFFKLKSQNCRFADFLNFSRIPIWYELENEKVADDLRYFRRGGIRFSRVKLDTGPACREDRLLWEPPTDRLKLLQSF